MGFAFHGFDWKVNIKSETGKTFQRLNVVKNKWKLYLQILATAVYRCLVFGIELACKEKECFSSKLIRTIYTVKFWQNFKHTDLENQVAIGHNAPNKIYQCYLTF